MPVAQINGHAMYYEIHGQGDPLICSGGWGTFCHGGERHVPEGLIDRHQVILFDHRAIGESSDDPKVPASTGLYADDVIGLIEHLGLPPVHLVGIVGIGACIFQEVAIRRPDLVRSLVNSGAWARVDTHFRRQMELWLEVHRTMGFAAFQRLVVIEGFDPAFVNARADKLMSSDGPWKELNGNLAAQERLTQAAVGHDTLDRLDRITVPALIIHTGRDQMTPPRFSEPLQAGIAKAEGLRFPDAPHVITEREDRATFAREILAFLARH